MQQIFNEALVKEVREGKLWLQCEGDLKRTGEVLRLIFPKDETKPPRASLFFTAFHHDADYWRCNDQIIDGNPWAKVSDFFLPAQPLRVEDVGDKQIIHCASLEEAKELQNLLSKSKWKTRSGENWNLLNCGYWIDQYVRLWNGDVISWSNGYEILPASLFLQPPAEKEGKERTYRVTREQLKELYPQTHSLEERDFIITLADMLGVLESQKEFSEKNVIDFVSEKMPVRLLALIFPEFNHSPIVPKGEFAWVRHPDALGDEWVCHMSAGNGSFYGGQKVTEETWMPKEVRKYEDRPF